MWPLQPLMRAGGSGGKGGMGWAPEAIGSLCWLAVRQFGKDQAFGERAEARRRQGAAAMGGCIAGPQGTRAAWAPACVAAQRAEGTHPCRTGATPSRADARTPPPRDGWGVIHAIIPWCSPRDSERPKGMGCRCSPRHNSKWPVQRHDQWHGGPHHINQDRSYAWAGRSFWSPRRNV
jgi:hypothetical protein